MNSLLLLASTPPQIPSKREMYSFYYGYEQCELAHIFKEICLVEPSETIPDGFIEVRGVLITPPMAAQVKNCVVLLSHQKARARLFAKLSDEIKTAWLDFSKGIFASIQTPDVTHEITLTLTRRVNDTWSIEFANHNAYKQSWTIGIISGDAMSEALWRLEVPIDPAQLNKVSTNATKRLTSHVC